MLVWCCVGDSLVDPMAVERVVLVSGKHYHALAAKRQELGRKDVALVRVEELCPFPVHHLQQELARYKKAKREYIPISHRAHLPKIHVEFSNNYLFFKTWYGVRKSHVIWAHGRL